MSSIYTENVKNDVLVLNSMNIICNVSIQERETPILIPNEPTVVQCVLKCHTFIIRLVFKYFKWIFYFKMFKCENCTSSFTLKDYLRRHEKTHKGIRFPCTICTSTFSNKCHQNRHMKDVHGMFLVFSFILIVLIFYLMFILQALTCVRSVLQPG